MKKLKMFPRAKIKLPKRANSNFFIKILCFSNYVTIFKPAGHFCPWLDRFQARGQKFVHPPFKGIFERTCQTRVLGTRIFQGYLRVQCSVFTEKLAEKYWNDEKLDQKHSLIRGGGRTFGRHCIYIYTNNIL